MYFTSFFYNAYTLNKKYLMLKIFKEQTPSESWIKLFLIYFHTLIPSPTKSLNSKKKSELLSSSKAERFNFFSGTD